jgi:hypothetical protein
VAEPLSPRHFLESVAEDSDPPVDPDPSLAAADYLSDMIAQLESMARAAGLDLLVYLLAMARVEAESNARMMGFGRGPRSRRP